MWYVYILLCTNNSLYTGASNNPNKRYQDHLNGKGSRYTRIYKPIRMVYVKKVGTKSQALKREHQIKTWTRKKKIKTLKLRLDQTIEVSS